MDEQLSNAEELQKRIEKRYKSCLRYCRREIPSHVYFMISIVR